ncbi:unnamed protein product [Tilletia laevis]|uniref:Uncharacterized protein n=2 Tax=Tilletia TaxID=13289 RepID=A0A8X7SVZ4_9BASI|nr:hypothetical protein CF336_g5111 [Tilletia laevis]KAE8191943.1 hypothetical protein CF328_g5530 [Tilletia controversa]KAE8256955.1 hypothetical protein A4X03_0g4888 [Tilletia caries]KAE8198450.1 hypothetical protein CF335_g4381 [Tilletia laevis]KAE8245272.1 hypothetical protein A4X06_0g5757 [Tilletia controversa]
MGRHNATGRRGRRYLPGVETLQHKDPQAHRLAGAFWPWQQAAAAGQLLHNHQRICFASETRQEKAKKCAIKKKYSFKEKRAKALDKLVKFDPAEWPAEAYNEIEKRTTMSRLDSWENRPFRANEPSSSAQ